MHSQSSSKTTVVGCIPRVWSFIALVAVLILPLTTAVQAQVVTNGIANTMEIGQNLVASNPPGTNDWLDGPTACVPGGSGGVLNNDGSTKSPLPPKFLFATMALDGVGNADITRFTEGSKFIQNPNAWAWDCNKPSAKTDINHGLVAISVDANSNLWAAVAGDRDSNNGDAYIDFEFLQRALFLKGNCTDGPDGFTSLGPDGGRTVGDLLVTLHFVNGGVIPEFYALIWTNVPGTTNFTYQSVTPPTGTAFVAQNNAEIPVCFGAYGRTTYDINTFAEAGVNLSELIPALKNNQCFTISTVFIKTKSSQSDTAMLKDFIEPIQLNLCVDSIPPVITGCPNNVTVECDADVPVANISLVTATDNCPAPVVITWRGDSASGTCPKTITRTYRATDDCGNYAECVQTITVNDITDPVLSGVPTNVTVQCLSQVPAAPTVTATDNCDGSITPAFVEESTGLVCNRTITRTWTATDACGNLASANQVITVHDTTPPVVAKGSIGACYNSIAAAEAAAIAATTANDNCGGTVNLSASTTGSCNAEITVTGTDPCLNTASVTYNTRVDVTGPVLPTLPTGGDLGCNPTPPTCNNSLTATDNCDGSLPVTCTPGSITGPACARSQTFTYSATDTCGNTSSGTVTYMWKEDTTAPVLPTLPTGGDLGCNPTPPTCNNSLTATDNCDGSVAVTCTPGAITGTCNKSQTFTYSATDGCGNTSSDTVTYTWKVDTTAPVLANVPTGGNLGCNPTLPSCSTAVTANDACDGTRPVNCTPGVITGPACARSQTFTYSATDLCGNTASATATYTWKEDITPPALANVPTGGNLGCNPTLPVCSTAVTASDNCDGTRPVNCTPGVITGPACARSQTFTYSATDLCGNTATATATYTWKEDTTAPVLPTLPTGGDLGCNPTPPTCDNSLTATDNCDGSVAVTCSAGTVSGTCNKSHTFTYSATDACGNTSSATVTYTWKDDTTAPTLTCVADRSVPCESAVTFDAPSASDTCDADPVVSVSSTVTNSLVPLSVTRTWIATDDCGNVSASCSQTVTVQLCGEGCTPGYWKNHTDSWPPTGYSTGQKLDTVFNFATAPGSVAALGNKTLLEGLNFQGGTNLRGAGEILLRAAVAALLSAAHPGVGYTLTEADVIAQVNAALASGDRSTMISTASILDAYNNLLCPLN